MSNEFVEINLSRTQPWRSLLSEDPARVLVFEQLLCHSGSYDSLARIPCLGVVSFGNILSETTPKSPNPDKIVENGSVLFLNLGETLRPHH